MIGSLLHILCILFVVGWWGHQQTILSKKIFWLALGIKLSAGLIVGYIYLEFYGGGDTLYLFETGEKIASTYQDGLWVYLKYLWQTHHPSFQSASRDDFYGKITSIPILLTAANFWLTNVYLSIFNFGCTLYLVKVIHEYYPKYRTQIIISFLFVPSCLIWTSGIFKETILVALIYVVFAQLVPPIKMFFKWKSLLLILVASYFIFRIKFYVLPPLLIGGSTILLLGISKNLKLSNTIKWLGISTILIAIVWLVSLFQYHLDLGMIPTSLFNNYQAISAASKGENVFQLPFTSDWLSIICYTPLALFTGLYRPFLFEGSLFNILFWIESSLLLCFTGFSLSQVKNWKYDSLLVGALVYISILAIFLCFATGNFGTMIRYRTVYWSLFVFVISILPIHHYLSFRQRIS